MSDLRLSPAQERSIALSTAPINVWDGAVRSGKTIASLLRWLMYIAQAPREGVLAIGGNTFDTVWRNVFTPLLDWSKFGEATKAIKYTRGAPTATILGRHIEVIPAADVRSERRLRGMTCAGFYLDEGTLVPESYFTQLLARLSVPGALLFLTTNPDGPSHWMKRDYLDRLGPYDLQRFPFTMDDNPGLTREYVARLKRLYQGLWYKRMILGQWCLAEGAVFDMWDPARHVIARHELPDIRRYIGLGIDYGTANPFAALMLGLGVDGLLYFVDEWRHDSRKAMRQLTDVEYSRALREWVGKWQHPKHPHARGVHPERWVVDPSALSFITQLWRDGVSPVQADNAVDDGLRTVAALLGSEPGSELLKVVDTCDGWITEIPGYTWDPKAAAEGRDEPHKQADHSLDGGRYILHTAQGDYLYDLRDRLDLAA
jgi:PBSX family phage terminase large subunit